MNTNTLLLVALGAGALVALAKSGAASTDSHPSGTYRLQFPATPGNATTPAHADLYSRDEDTNDGSTAPLYTKTPGGNYQLAPAFLFDLNTGNLIG